MGIRFDISGIIGTFAPSNLKQRKQSMKAMNQTECINSVSNYVNVRLVAFNDMQKGKRGGNPLQYDDTFWNSRRAYDEINHWTMEKMFRGIDIEQCGSDYAVA